MRQFPLLMGITLLFWGWQVDAIGFALLLGGIIEVARVIPYQGRFKQGDFERVSDIATILLIISLVYLYGSGNIRAFVVVVRWLPIILFPLVGLQLLADRDQVNVRLFFRMIRTKKIRKHKPFYLDLTYPYFGITILSGSASANRNFGMYWSAVALITLFLILHKGKRLNPLIFVVIMIGIAVGGFGGQVVAYHTLKNVIKNWGGKGQSDPLKSHTGIGQIGSLKFSDQIVFRVKSDTPLLLRETSYHHYYNGNWTVKKWDFSQLTAGGDDDTVTWDLQKDPDRGAATVEVFEPYDGKKQLLKLPLGTTKIEDLPAERLKRNGYGAVIAEDAPSMLHYTVKYRNDRADDLPPEKSDLWVPKKERKGLNQVIQKYHLKEIPKDNILAAIRGLFQNDYHYTLTQKTKGSGSALDHFLNTTHGGHCEYFASSTVLLLRQLEIPARYVVGYSVSEYSDFEGRYLVRERDAHAWSLAYINGKWINLDTTPASWQNFGNQGASGSIGDFLSWLSFKFSLWQAELSIQEQAKPLLWLLFAILAFRLIWLGLKGRKKVTIFETIEIIGEIITLLEKKYSPRERGDTLKEWSDMILSELSQEMGDLLMILLQHYYQYRYDPHSYDQKETQKLMQLTQNWLKQWDQEQNSDNKNQIN